MSHAERCPVCLGKGTVKMDDWGQHESTGGQKYPTTCHGCGGTGWVTVQDQPQWVVSYPASGSGGAA